jgi:hypothetical protein
MSQERATQPAALRDRVDARERQVPMVVVWMELVHLLEHTADVLERSVVHAAAHERHDGLPVGCGGRPRRPG